jgi:hypothetical protein
MYKVIKGSTKSVEEQLNSLEKTHGVEIKSSSFLGTELVVIAMVMERQDVMKRPEKKPNADIKKPDLSK